MTTTATTMEHLPLHRRRLPRGATWIALAISVALAGIIGLALSWNVAAIAVVAAAIFLIALPTWSAVVENRRAAKDRAMTALLYSALVIALIPLASMLITVVSKGIGRFNAVFFTSDIGYNDAPQGGILHALIGTVIITLIATIISVPIGIMTAIYLTEYGGKSRLAASVRFLIDVMTGLPSIVAGLFVVAFFGIIIGPKSQMGFGGGVALSILMIPIVVRASEEMLKLVPHELREASYALGVPKSRTIARVVVPTALSGIITGVTLAIARVIGETAPLLLVAGATDFTNTNPFSQQMASLPVLIYNSYRTAQPGDGLVDLAWGAALLLIIVVLLLNLLARLAGKFFAPKTGN